MDRREFLKWSALAGLACAGAGQSKENPAIFPIIDTHQHLWDLSRVRLPWLKNRPSLAKSHLMEDYLMATADPGRFPAGTDTGSPGKIVKSIYMEVDLDPAKNG